MKKNMGGIDKVVRIAIALLAAALYFTNLISGTLAIIGITVAGVFTLTSLIGFCPIYGIFGLSSAKKKEAQ